MWSGDEAVPVRSTGAALGQLRSCRRLELACTRLPNRSIFGLVAGTANFLGINLFLASPCLTSMTSPAKPWPSTSCEQDTASFDVC